MNHTERPLGPSDVIPIASNLTIEDNTFIVGGQATNLWAWYYQDKVAYLKDSGPFTSQDIDYFGEIDVAQKLAEAINGRVLKPNKDTMNSPNTAVVEVTIDGREIRIDFLNKILGIKNHEKSDGVSILEITAEIDGEDIVVEIPIMHPLFCLRSRIANILHAATRRTDATAIRQLHAAYHVTEAYIHHALDDGDHREAIRTLTALHRYLRWDEFGRIAHRELKIDPLSILTLFATDERIDGRFRQNALVKWADGIRESRAERDQRVDRAAKSNQTQTGS